MDNSLLRIHEIISKNTTGTIILPTNPSVDAIAAACALYLGLIKMGKNVSLACSQKVQSDLTAADKISENFTTGGDSLVVSIPYTDGAVDNVNYSIQGQNFNVVVTPRPGYPKLNPQQVNYSYTGGTVDFIIVIDSPTLNNLGAMYTDNQSQFTGHDIINIDRHLTNAFFGTVNHVNKTSSSVSELALEILQNLQVEIDRDIATNMYAGIAAATNNFTSYSVNADTFEHIAALLRYGAIKKINRKPAAQDENMFVPPASSFKPPMPMASQQHPEIMTKPIQKVEKDTRGDQPQSAQDWLKPKIFKGSGLI